MSLRLFAVELLNHILLQSVYDYPDFSPIVDYTDRTATNSDFVRRHSSFARNTVLISPEIHIVGLRVLWRCVVVRSREYLRILVDQATYGVLHAEGQPLGVNTERLEVRITGDYDRVLLAELVGLMPNLKIFILRNEQGPRFTPRSAMLPPIIEALQLHCPRLSHVEFLSPHEMPTVQHLRNIFRDATTLRSLRVVNISMPEAAYPVNGPGLAAACPTVQKLSLGFDHWTYKSQDRDSDFQSLGDVLSAVPVLPGLTALHFPCSYFAMRSICATYGKQIKELLCVSPEWRTMAPAYCHILDLCPHVRHFIWILSSFQYIPPLLALPARHDVVDTITVVYADRHIEPSIPIVGIEDAADLISASAFPALRRIRYVDRSEQSASPPLNNLEWYEDVVSRFAAVGVEVIDAGPYSSAMY